MAGSDLEKVVPGSGSNVLIRIRNCNKNVIDRLQPLTFIIRVAVLTVEPIVPYSHISPVLTVTQLYTAQQQTDQSQLYIEQQQTDHSQMYTAQQQTDHSQLCIKQ